MTVRLVTLVMMDAVIGYPAKYELGGSGWNDELKLSRRRSRGDMDVIFRLLSSDDESDGDAATTLGSPVPAAQTLEWASPPPASDRAPRDESAWTQRRSTTTLQQPSRVVPRRPKRLEELFAEPSVLSAKEGAKEKDHGDEDANPLTPSEPSELLLSPASQLHVLSQISEMADSRAARARQELSAPSGFRPPVGVSVPPPRHVWAPAHEQTPFLPLSLPQMTSASKRRPAAPKPRPQKKQRSGNEGVRAGLLADVATWEVFEEPILAGDDVDDGAWSFDELSDSDF